MCELSHRLMTVKSVVFCITIGFHLRICRWNWLVGEVRHREQIHEIALKDLFDATANSSPSSSHTLELTAAHHEARKRPQHPC